MVITMRIINKTHSSALHFSCNSLLFLFISITDKLNNNILFPTLETENTPTRERILATTPVLKTDNAIAKIMDNI